MGCTDGNSQGIYTGLFYKIPGLFWVCEKGILFINMDVILSTTNFT
ncbi:hypothetical protein N752_30600 [Desulforamulus aquiferis]|nr:hypothetical protein N752_30600 [Desulforamulus aquiferis]